MTSAAVLIADESALIRAVARDILEEEGYRVAEAGDGLTALEACRQEPPDVVLFDIEMPGLDGYQVLAELNSNAELKHIPVVFLTSRASVEDVIVAGRRGGAHDYLKKPFEPAELLARVGSAIQIKKLQDELRQRNADLDRMSRTDELTGLYNRRHLDEELVRLHSDASRHHQLISLLLLDIDHFKRINDAYGDPAGDQVLRTFAERLRAVLRAGDIAGRWAGEKFLVVLPRTDLAGAREVAERIRFITAFDPVVADGKEISMTVSGGCALGPGESVEAVVSLADRCLYEAKQAGRNRVVIATFPSTR
ncbi:diguanylate cyclase [Kribbella sp. NPDC023972]|uniref:diguanylate cyclase domain-containing protein n=1 Tax=Kribbella sp. NPDC023972 TaxID=3154795 RepID=UPI0033F2AF1E